MPTKFEIDALVSNPNTKITIILPSGEIIPAFMKQETFSISGTANFESALDRSATETLTGGLGGGAQTVIEYLQRALQTRTASLSESILSYSRSETPQFNVDLLFIALRPDDDVRKPVYKLLQGTYPVTGIAGSKGLMGIITDNVLMSPPWGYNLKDGGKFAVKIGKWFSATQQVLKDASFQLSKETIKTGVPLYAEGTIAFSPYRMIDGKELLQYFPGMSG